MPISDAVPSEEELVRCAGLRGGLGSALANVQFFPRKLDPDGLITILSTIVNRGDGASWRAVGAVRARDDQLLASQVFDFDTDVSIDADGIGLGESRLSLLSVKGYPERVYFGQMAYLVSDLLTGARGLRFPFFLNVNIHFPEPQGFKNKLASGRAWVANTAFGAAAKWMPSIHQRKKDFDVLFGSLDDGHRPVRLAMTLGIYSESREGAKSAIEAARTYMSEQSFTFNHDRFIAGPLMMNCLPLGADREVVGMIGRYRTMTTQHATQLLPVFADWKGSGTPAMTFVSRSGQMVSFSIFDTDTNYNTVIAAQSGSGKSFVSNELISSYLSLGGQVWVIDIGGSYRKLCKDLGGEYIEFRPDEIIGLNPFPLVKDYGEECGLLEDLVATMAAPTEKLSDIQRSELSRHMRETYEKLGHGTTIDAIAAALLGDDDQRIRDIGTQLYPFCSSGSFGAYFAGTSTVTLDGHFTVVELEHLRNRKHLQRVVLLMLMFKIQAAMYDGNKDRPKIVLIDEGWDLIRDGDVGRFIEHGYRRFRKYGGAAILVTQSLADLDQSDVGKAILANSANVMLLAQKAESIDALVQNKTLGIGAFAERILKSVHTIAGSYSEIYFRTPAGEGIGRLVVSPFQRLLYSTKADHVEAIRRLEAQGLSVSEAIETLLQSQRKGRAA